MLHVGSGVLFADSLTYSREIDMKMALEGSWLRTCSCHAEAKRALNDSISCYGEELPDFSLYPTSNATRWDGKLGPTRADRLTSCRQLCQLREVGRQKMLIETT